jgi:hypothetical protein
MKNGNFFSFIGAIVAKILKSKEKTFMKGRAKTLIVAGLRAWNPRRI